MSRYIKVLTVINGDDSGTWINADHIVAVIDREDGVLVATTTGCYHSADQDYIDILSELDLVIDETHGIALPGLHTAMRGKGTFA